MEEMRGAALAYYANMADDKKQEVLSFFMLLDKNGDGEVSIQEYKEFMKELGGDGFNPANLFKFLDKNNDGTLDFEECITLFYMIIGERTVMCDGCGCFLWGLYFMCVECYKADGNTFDLCTSCYRYKKYNHAHAHFLDNYALLRMKPWKDDTSEPVDSRKEKDDTSEPVDSRKEKVTPLKKVAKRGSKRAAIKKAIEVINLGYDIGQVVDIVANSPDAGEVAATAGEAVAAVGEVLAAAASCTIM